MKRIVSLILSIFMLFSLAACQSAGSEAPGPASPSAPQSSAPSPAQSGPAGGDAIPYQTASLLIVEKYDDGTLFLAGKGSGEVYTLTPAGCTVLLDGQSADPSVLEDGMTVDIEYNSVLDSFPAQLADVISISAYSLGTQRSPGGACYDLCGLYLQVLEDLWQRDEGLNDGAEYISVDLSKAPGMDKLGDGARTAVSWIFASLHNAAPLSLSYDELIKEGYLTPVSDNDGAAASLYYWEDGLLFTITDAMPEGEVYSLPVVKFNAHKWRTPLGAYFFGQCSAVWPAIGTWSGYNIGAEAIS